MFRCPYCGEAVFSTALKMGICSKFGTAPRCPACNRVCQRSTGTGGYWLYSLLLSITALVSFGCIVLSFIAGWPILLVIGLALLLGLYLVISYYFSHFETMYAKDRLAMPRFCIEATACGRLWPAIRAGEIYKIQLLRDNTRDSACPYVLGMIETIDRQKDCCIFTVRCIKTEGADSWETAGKMRIVTDGMLTVTGKPLPCKL